MKIQRYLSLLFFVSILFLTGCKTSNQEILLRDKQIQIKIEEITNRLELLQTEDSNSEEEASATHPTTAPDRVEDAMLESTRERGEEIEALLAELEALREMVESSPPDEIPEPEPEEVEVDSDDEEEPLEELALPEEAGREEVPEPVENNCALNGVLIDHGDSKIFFDRSLIPLIENCDDHQQERICNDGVLSGSVLYSKTSCERLRVLDPVVPDIGGVIIPEGGFELMNRSCELGGVTIRDGESYDFYSTQSSAICSISKQTRACEDGVLQGDFVYQYASCEPPVGRFSCQLDGVTISTGENHTFYSQVTVPFGQNCSDYSQNRSCLMGFLRGDSEYEHATCNQLQVLPIIPDMEVGVLGGMELIQNCELDGVTVASGSTRTFYSKSTVPLGAFCSGYDQERSCNNGVLSGGNNFKYENCSQATLQPLELEPIVPIFIPVE
jgi:hypothetical protein